MAYDARRMRRSIITLALAAALALPAAALAGPPFKVRPHTVEAGNVVKVDGKPGGGCGEGSTVTIYSRAFKSDHEFAGVPAVFAKVRHDGRFTKHVRIPASRPSGDYSVGARCGGGNLGARTLHVVHGQGGA
jgi:hypothetical protein